MSTIEAWQAVFNLSTGNQWVKIPKNLTQILGLPNRIGICGGVLCTQNSANGLNRFIDTVNQNMESNNV